MRLGLLLVALATMSPIVLSAQQGKLLHQALAAAQDQSDIFNRAQHSFLLEADLRVQLAAPTAGHLKIQWLSKNHWRRELEYGAYHESVVRVGEQEYALRNVGFAPLRTTQLVELLQFAKGSSGFAPNGAKNRKRRGTLLSCIELADSTLKLSYELCNDPVTHDIASISPWTRSMDGGEADFSSYQDFQEMRFPMHLNLRIGKGNAVEVNVTKLQEQPVDPSLMVPPAGAVERRYCDTMTPPIMIRHPDPSDFGAFSDDVHVRFQVTILKDGSVDSFQVIGQSSAKAAERIRKALKDAKYKPAMCGTEPVVADVVEGVDITH